MLALGDSCRPLEALAGLDGGGDNGHAAEVSTHTLSGAPTLVPCGTLRARQRTVRSLGNAAASGLMKC